MITRRAFLNVFGLSAAAARCGAGPAGRPGSAAPARRWAMAVDLQACATAGGCTACVEACHRAHNVPRVPEVAHEVKWIWKEPFPRAFPQQDPRATPARLRGVPVLVFCNHCDNPPCVRVCPVKATWKRPDGIVMIDAHRCIGCRYCVAACPYGSRSFNWSDPGPHLVDPTPDYPTRARGVVEKCSFCEERLDSGTPPACVEACETHALVFGDADDPASPVRRALENRFSLQRRPELGTRPQVYYVV